MRLKSSALADVRVGERAQRGASMKTKFGASCAVFLTALSGAAGCSGQIGDPQLETVSPGAGGTGVGTGAGGGQFANCVQGAPFAPARVWLLSDEEYVNVVRDVF